MKLLGEEVTLDELLKAYEGTLDPIFPRRAENIDKADPVIEETKEIPDFYVHTNVARPRVFIPTMPGNNCEVDSARAFERAGAVSDIFIFRNRDSAELKASVDEMAERIRHAQIVMFPGGFSAGDEPDGSGKFIAAVFRNQKLMEAMDQLLHVRDGLAMGICNGFQALIKLGLVPYGEFKPLTDDAVRAADVVVTMGCGDTCPVLPGIRYEDWVVGDPALASHDGVMAITAQIDAHVRTLLASLIPDLELPEPR